MRKKFALVLLLVSTFGCKKHNEFSDDNTNLYRWKRDFYRAGVQKDAPAFFLSRNGGGTWSTAPGILIRSDVVVLTEYRKDEQQDSIFKASGKMEICQYEKLERVE